ncbi:hypothetical protein BGW41_006325 [Actinomortierella wolfii]|nr:hypothetical protein BGW41_006325 [Actinomortierella wolfii]
MEHHESAEPLPITVETVSTSVSIVSEDMSSSTASPPSSGRSTPFSTMSDASTVGTSSFSSSPPSPSLEKQEHHRSLQRQSSVQNLRDKRASFFNRRDIVISDTRYFGGRNTTSGDYSNVSWSASSSATFPRIRTDPNHRSRFQNLLAQWKARDTPSSRTATTTSSSADGSAEPVSVN